MFLFGYPSLTLVFLVSVPDFLLGEEAGGLGAGVLSLVAGTARFTRDMAQLRAEVAAEDGEAARARQQQAGYSYSQGYGGKFGVMADRQDTSALGWDNKQQNEQK